MSGTFRCPGCKGHFQTADAYRTVGLNKVCSDECLAALRKPKKSTDRKPTPKKKPNKKSEIPAKNRATLWVRDRGCRFCGSRAAEAHHICYKSEGVDHQLQNLVLLCQEHHTLVHSNKTLWKPILLGYVWMVMVEGRRMTIPAVRRLIERNTP